VRRLSLFSSRIGRFCVGSLVPPIRRILYLAGSLEPSRVVPDLFHFPQTFVSPPLIFSHMIGLSFPNFRPSPSSFSGPAREKDARSATSLHSPLSLFFRHTAEDRSSPSSSLRFFVRPLCGALGGEAEIPCVLTTFFLILADFHRSVPRIGQGIL